MGPKVPGANGTPSDFGNPPVGIVGMVKPLGKAPPGIGGSDDTDLPSMGGLNGGGTTLGGSPR